MTAERLEDLAVFLLELLSDDQVTKSKEVAIKKVLSYYYAAPLRNHSLESLYEFIDDKKESLLKELNIDEKDFSVYNFLHILSEYVDDGLYNFLFSVSEDQTYKIEDKRLIVFELDEVKDNKEILSVMLKLIKSAIQRTIWRNKAGKATIRTEQLNSEGFNPNYFTHYWKNTKGDVYLFVYEYGFLKRTENTIEKYILIQWQDYMEK